MREQLSSTPYSQSTSSLREDAVLLSFEPLRKELVSQDRSASDLALIEKAYRTAAKIHEKEKRISGDPYIIHPLATASHVIAMRLDAETIAAALLHDTCEETGFSSAALRKEFGEEIAFLVEGVTKLDHIRYRGQERSAESLRKMFLAIADDIRVVLLKLTDRLHNMETLSFLPPEKQKRIALETLEIYAPLSYRLGMKELAGRLEDLAFPYVYPDQYRQLLSLSKETYEDWHRYSERIQPLLASELTQENISFLDIHARAKHYYSLYKKLLKYDGDIKKITDIVALRVIVPSLADCYAALGVIHKLWRPMPGKIKDYIALPKPNGYQSLHTTIFGPEERLVEIQMRTPSMHEEAEHGIAAHWAYGELKRKNPSDYAKKTHLFADKKRFAWIQQIAEWQKKFEHPDEFLESLKIDFFSHRIFVLTPKGDVIDLPDGATPIDFAYHIHSDIGDKVSGARVNEKMVSLDYMLKNGDIVHILTQKNKKPSPDWLTFVKTVHARKHIASALRKK
jgi:GTP pyrophosphokinase